MCIRLLRLGYNEYLIEKYLVEVSSELSTQTIVDLLNYDYEAYAEEEDKIHWVNFREILRNALSEKFQHLDTEFKNKKVYLDTQDYDIAHSMILKSEEGGYNRGGMAFKIPDEANKVRFFVYWNDKSRVDIDLHAMFTDVDGGHHHVGWDGSHCDTGVVTSGDITHSDAAEYIDFDLNNPELDFATAAVSLFSGANSFKDVETCFVGLMGVSKLGEDIKLYDPKACFISQDLKSDLRDLNYGVISVQDRYIRYLGKANDQNYFKNSTDIIQFSLQTYLQLLFEAQDVILVENKEDAEIEMSIAKGKGISLMDENFYIDK